MSINQLVLMFSQSYLNQIVAVIHSFDEMKGCEVVFLDKAGEARTIHQGDKSFGNYHSFLVVIEDISHIYTLTATKEPTVKPSEQQILNSSKLHSEAVDAGFSCVAAAFGIGTMIAGSAPTGGLAIAVAWTGTVTSSLKCVKGIVNVWEAHNTPNSSSISDREAEYKSLWNTIDVLNVASGLAGLGLGTRDILKVLQQKRGIPNIEVLEKMTKTERAEKIAEVIRSLKGDATLAEALVKSVFISKNTIDGGRKVFKSKSADKVLATIGVELNRKLAKLVFGTSFKLLSVHKTYNYISGFGNSSGEIMDNLAQQILELDYNSIFKANHPTIESLSIPKRNTNRYLPTYIIHIMDK